MSTDFFDGDLRPEGRGVTVPLSEAISRGGDTISSRSISRLVEQKQGRASQMVGTAQEIELLRLRQRELEQEKEKLETLARKQEKYESQKREILDQLERSLVQFDKQSGDALRAAETLTAVRATFDDALGGIREIVEESWDARQFEDELNRACLVVENARETYRKGMTKINALGWLRGAAGEASAEFMGDPVATPRSGTFTFWLKAGMAFSLPMMIFLLLAFGLWWWWGGSAS